MNFNGILKNADSLIVLLVGEFKSSKIEQLFRHNFINILYSNHTTNAQKLIDNNTIDIVLCDKSSIDDAYELINYARQVNESTLCMISSHELNTEDLLMSIDLKIDAHLYEQDNFDKIYEQITNLIVQYHKKKNAQCFGEDYNEECHSNIVSKTNKRGFITYVNKPFCEATGYSEIELLGKNHNIIRHEDNTNALFHELWDTICVQKKPWQGIIKNLSKEGMAFYAKSIITPLMNEKGEILEYIAQRINISKQFCDKSKLFYSINNHDLSVLAMIQIEGFDILEELYHGGPIKTIEKNFGLELLKKLPNQDIFSNIYFLGQGRYALHCDFYHFLKQSINMEEYFKNFVQSVNTSTLDFEYFEEEIKIALSFSYGKENLFQDAQYGLSQALQKQISVFDANDIYIKESSHKKEHKNIMKTIKVALDNSKIVSYFQPIINNETLSIDKYESLVRLVDEQDNVLSPESFLDVAKQTHYYSRITHNVLVNSFEMLHKVDQDVTINICMSDIERKETMDIFFSLLDEYQPYAHRIVIELLEDENVNSYSVIKAFITGVKQKGVKVAIDDFGSGYSNFERLLAFQPDIIKIDGSLIKNIENDVISRNLVETISFLSKKQNIKTVAEYVENENIYNILKDIGIDYSQGYFFGKPQRLACH